MTTRTQRAERRTDALSRERIVEAGIARKVHEWLADGQSAEEAAKRAVDLVGETDLAIIVIDPKSLAAAAGRKGMAWAGREAGASEWRGP